MAGELGFEPRFSESESDVLPLNYSPIFSSRSATRSGRNAALRKRFALRHLNALSKSFDGRPAIPSLPTLCKTAGSALAPAGESDGHRGDAENAAGG